MHQECFDARLLQHGGRAVHDVPFGDAAQANLVILGDAHGLRLGVEFDRAVVDQFAALFDFSLARQLGLGVRRAAKLPQVAHGLKRDVEGALGSLAFIQRARDDGVGFRTNVHPVLGVQVDLPDLAVVAPFTQHGL